MVAEAGVPIWTGGCSIITDTEVAVTAVSGLVAQDKTTSTEVRVMGLAATTDIASGTGAHTGAKGIHPTQTTPSTDRDSSAVIRPTAMEVVRDK